MNQFDSYEHRATSADCGVPESGSRRLTRGSSMTAASRRSRSPPRAHSTGDLGDMRAVRSPTTRIRPRSASVL